MKFLLFNFAVIAALVYLFTADRIGLGLGSDQGEESLQALRQELESLAQDLADGQRKAAAPAETVAAQGPEPEEAAETPPAEQAAATPEAPADQAATPAAAAVPSEASAPEPTPEPAEQAAQPALAKQDPAPVPAQEATKPEAEPEQNGVMAVAAESLPPVDDPAVARRRAEVLEGVVSVNGTSNGESTVKAGPPMTSDERLRRLYSLAEEMELLYVSKISR